MFLVAIYFTANRTGFVRACEQRGEIRVKPGKMGGEMLKRLSLQNVAIVDAVDVALDAGLTVITGETGAGKSLLISAIALVFGKKVSPADVLRYGEKRGRIELTFDFSVSRPAIQQFLQEEASLELPAEDTELLISREFTPSSSRARINGIPVTLDVLSQLRSMVVDLHGQHELTSLFDDETHGRILDSLGDADFNALQQTVASAYERWFKLKKELEAKQAKIQDMANQRDYLEFQLRELDEAHLVDPQEDKTCQAELKRLGQGESLKKQTGKAYQTLWGNDRQGVGDLLEKVQKMLASLFGVDPMLDELAQRLDTQREELRALASDLKNYHDKVSFSSRQIDELVERLDQLEKLKRKHGPSLVEVLATQEEIRQTLQADEQAEKDLRLLEAALEAAKGDLEQVTGQLTLERERLASQFTEQLTTELRGLELPRVRFQVAFNPRSGFSPLGAESIAFLFSANPGEPPRPLVKSASGGELSRILLAIKVVTAEKSGVQTLVFDEIDAGISGPTAKAVSQRLYAMARHLQVIAITHQPILAAYGEHHLHVEKSAKVVDSIEKNEMVVQISELSHHQEQRMRVLSRLVSGMELDQFSDTGTARQVEQFVQQLLDQPKAG